MDKGKKRIWMYEAALLLVAVVWGGGFMATRIAVDERMSASLILTGRFLIAAAVFGCAFAGPIRRRIDRRGCAGGAAVGVLLFLSFTTQTLAMEGTTPSNAGFLTATNVIMVPFLWWIAAKKRPPGRMIAACALCLCGIAALSLKAGGFSFAAGDALALLGAVFFACHIVFTGWFSVRDVDARVLVFVQFLTASLLSLVYFLLFDRDITPLLHPKGFLAVAYLGIFSTCLCFFLQAVAQVHVPASKAALFLCTESLFCSVFSVMMGFEPVTGAMLTGGVMILASVVLAEYTPKKAKATAGCGD